MLSSSNFAFKTVIEWVNTVYSFLEVACIISYQKEVKTESYQDSILLKEHKIL